MAAENIFVGNGSLQIIQMLFQLHRKRNGILITENPTYDRTLTCAQELSLKTIGIPDESDGPNMEQLDLHFSSLSGLKLFYVIPDFQNPTGITWSLEKRKAVVDLADRYGVTIVEDSPYRMLRYSGNELPSLYSMNPERVLHLSSFTKIIAPGVRVG